MALLFVISNSQFVILRLLRFMMVATMLLIARGVRQRAKYRRDGLRFGR